MGCAYFNPKDSLSGKRTDVHTLSSDFNTCAIYETLHTHKIKTLPFPECKRGKASWAVQQLRKQVPWLSIKKQKLKTQRQSNVAPSLLGDSFSKMLSDCRELMDKWGQTAAGVHPLETAQAPVPTLS